MSLEKRISVRNNIQNYKKETTENSKKEEWGFSESKNGSYMGFWKEGKRHGEGHYQDNKNKHTYSGQWIADKKHGRGTIAFKDGTAYNGQWNEDQPYGKGTFTDADGTKIRMG